MGAPLTVSLMADLIRLQMKPGDWLVCDGCGFGGGGGIGDADVIEHAMFDHTSRFGVTVVREIRLLSGYEVARFLGLSAQTEHEERWREENPQT